MNQQKQCGVDVPKKLIQDVNTRWNSTFYMLERFVESEHNSVRSTVAILDSTLPILTSEEWTILKEQINKLSLFQDATKAVSGESYISESLVIVLAGGLHKACERMLQFQWSSEMSRNVVRELQSGVRSRMGNVKYSTRLAISTILDPPFKMLPFQNQDANAKKALIGSVADLISKINEKVKGSNDVVEVESPAKKVQEVQEKLNFSVWDSFDKCVSVHVPVEPSNSSRAIVEVQRYLEDGLLPRHENPMLWWSQQKYNYPYLSVLVRHKCCTVPYERLFSKAGNVLTDRRTRLTAGKLQKLLFLNVTNQYLRD